MDASSKGWKQLWRRFASLVLALDEVLATATDMARTLIQGPTFAHGMAKTMLNQEWNMGLDQAIEAEPQAQAICMQTADFERAYKAFVAKETPVFEGN